MYKISEITKGKIGYLLLEKVTLFFCNPNTSEYEFRLGDVEIFGRAIKATYFDNYGNPEYEANYFSDTPISGNILTQIDNNHFLYEFNSVIFALDENGIKSMNDMSNANETVIDYFFEQYKIESATEPSAKSNSDINSMTGIEFEVLCKELLQKMGFEVQQTKTSGDGGIDLIAINHQPFLEGTYIVQCKRYAGSVGEPIIRDLYGVVCSERANKGILMTTGKFTSSAVSFAQGKNIELIDGEKLFSLLGKYSIPCSNSNIESIETDVNNLTSLFDFDEDDPLTMRQIIGENNVQGNNIVENAIKRCEEYYYDEYIELKNSVHLSPTNNENRARLIEKLMYLLSLANHTHDKEEFVKSKSAEGYSPDQIEELYAFVASFYYTTIEKQAFYREIRDNCLQFLTNSSKIDVLEIEIMFLAMQTSFFLGDFYDAYKQFVSLTKVNLYSNPKSLNNYVYNTGLADLLFDAIYSCVQICCIVNDIPKAERIINTYKSLIDEKICRCEKANIENDGRFTNLLEIYKNMTNVGVWLGISEYEINNAIEARYGIGNEEYNGEDIYDIKINSSNDCMTISDDYLELTVVNNLSDCIRKFQNNGT